VSGGFGGGSWGGGAFGGSSAGGPAPFTGTETVTFSESLTVDLPLLLVGAVALSPTLVLVTFSHDIDPLFSTNFNASNYNISPPLAVVGVVPSPSPNAVFVSTAPQDNFGYLLTVTTAKAATGDFLEPPNQIAGFVGFPVIPNFFATGQAKRKVVLIFSTNMLINAALVDAASYTITDLNGGAIPVSSVDVVPDGSRVTLNLGADLTPGGYYSVQVDAAVVSSLGGYSLNPNTDLFQWAAMEGILLRGPLTIPFSRFSGEVTTGLLGQPAGQVFFSPALLQPASPSIIEIDEVALCTKSYDSYEFPQLVDPPPLYTFRPGAPSTVLGGTSSLWAPAERLGLARVNLTDSHTDTLPTATDGPCDATLVEPIDITRAGFLNDARWHLYDGTATTFIAADNLTPIGPGPTVNINLEP